MPANSEVPTADLALDLAATPEESALWRTESAPWQELAGRHHLAWLLRNLGAAQPWVTVARGNREAQAIGGAPLGVVVELAASGGFRTAARAGDVGDFVTLPEHCRWWVARARTSELWAPGAAADLIWAHVRAQGFPHDIELRPLRQRSNRSR